MGGESASAGVDSFETAASVCYREAQSSFVLHAISDDGRCQHRAMPAISNGGCLLKYQRRNFMRQKMLAIEGGNTRVDHGQDVIPNGIVAYGLARVTPPF
jgi:hypothetical protein